jgi:hypothetical protein
MSKQVFIFIQMEEANFRLQLTMIYGIQKPPEGLRLVPYWLAVVGTARCAVRAACSGATSVAGRWYRGLSLPETAPKFGWTSYHQSHFLFAVS